MISFAVPPAADYSRSSALVARAGAEFPNVLLKVIGDFSGYIHEWLVR